MFKRVAGFTIIEVLTVLAVTGVMFIGAVSLVQTQNGRSQFSQAVNDIDGKLNKYITDLHSGVDPTSEKYSCNGYPSSAKPTLIASGSDTSGTNGQCLFLGRAIQVNLVTKPNEIYVYTILGNRQMADPLGGPNPVPVDTFTNAKPEPAFASQPTTTETYTIPYGVRVKSSTFTCSGACASPSNIAGFYNSPNANGVTQIAKNYAYATDGKITGGTGQSCLEEVGCANSAFTRWDLCITDGSINAILSITPTSAGIRTEIKYTSC